MRIGAQQVIWITGAKGRLGRAIDGILDHGRYAVLATDTEVDIADYGAVSHFVALNRPDIIINCAGMTDRAWCEAHPTEAFRANALGARNVAAAAQSINSRVVQLSTDAVFSGQRNVYYDEFDTPHPNTVYGKSKLAGEAFIRDLNPLHVIVRSSWVYADISEHIFANILQAGRTGTPLEVPANQFSTPTSALALARCIVTLIEADEFGIFHAANKGVCSRFEFAIRVLRDAGLPTDMIVPTYEPENAYTLALDNMMLKMTGVHKMPKWEDDLQEYISLMAHVEA